MKPLSKEASAALSALKATDPTAEDEARVRKNVERALGVAIPVAGVAAATTATTAKAATGLFSAMGAKVAVLVAVTTVTAATVVSLSSKGGEGRGEEQLKSPPAAVAITPPPEVKQPAPEAPPEPPEAPEVVASPQPPPPPVKQKPQPRPAEAPPPEPEPAPAPVVAVEPPAPPPPPPTSETWDLEVEANFPNCDPATELRSAQSARKLLDADRAEDAVWLLGAYQRRCASGRWSNEAWSVRMAGLCKLNRTAEVIGLLQWFSTEYPTRREAVLTELRSFCSEDVLKHGAP